MLEYNIIQCFIPVKPLNEMPIYLLWVLSTVLRAVELCVLGERCQKCAAGTIHDNANAIGRLLYAFVCWRVGVSACWSVGVSACSRFKPKRSA